MEQCLDNWKWAKTIPETQASFNEMVHIWTQVAQQTATLDFSRQVGMPTHHVILEQIVRKMPPWAKKAHSGEPTQVFVSAPALDHFERGGDHPYDSVIYGQHPRLDNHSS